MKTRNTFFAIALLSATSFVSAAAPTVAAPTATDIQAAAAAAASSAQLAQTLCSQAEGYASEAAAHADAAKGYADTYKNSGIVATTRAGVVSAYDSTKTAFASVVDAAKNHPWTAVTVVVVTGVFVAAAVAFSNKNASEATEETN